MIRRPGRASDVSDDDDGDDGGVFDDGALCPTQGPRSLLHSTNGDYSVSLVRRGSLPQLPTDRSLMISATTGDRYRIIATTAINATRDFPSTRATCATCLRV